MHMQILCRFVVFTIVFVHAITSACDVVCLSMSAVWVLLWTALVSNLIENLCKNGVSLRRFHFSASKWLANQSIQVFGVVFEYSMDRVWHIRFVFGVDWTSKNILLGVPKL